MPTYPSSIFEVLVDPDPGVPVPAILLPVQLNITCRKHLGSQSRIRLDPRLGERPVRKVNKFDRLHDLVGIPDAVLAYVGAMLLPPELARHHPVFVWQHHGVSSIQFVDNVHVELVGLPVLHCCEDTSELIHGGLDEKDRRGNTGVIDPVCVWSRDWSRREEE